MQIKVPVFQGSYIPINLRSFHTLRIETALKQKNVRLLIAFFRKQFGDTDRNDR
jgi:hypothetical protein